MITPKTPAEAAHDEYWQGSPYMNEMAKATWSKVAKAAIDAHLAQVAEGLPTIEDISAVHWPDDEGAENVLNLFTERFAKLKAQRDFAEKACEASNILFPALKSDINSLATELETERDCKEVAIKTLNRYGEIIHAMATALEPKDGEHNIDAAKRVVAERDKAQLNVALGDARLEAYKRIHSEQIAELNQRLIERTEGFMARLEEKTKRERYVPLEDARILIMSAYERGHNDTVESCFADATEVANELIETLKGTNQ